jgi:hypothetical protein
MTMQVAAVAIPAEIFAAVLRFIPDRCRIDS